MSSKPLVSIGLPVYNGAEHIAETVESLLDQKFGDFELIISDNASTDATQDICTTYARQDQRIRYYRKPRNLGAAANYNSVFEMGTGKYFKWAPHDDVYAPGFLKSCVHVLERSDTRVVLAYPRTMLIDENSGMIGEHEDHMDTRELVTVRRFARMLANPVSWCHAVLGLIRAEVLKKTRLIGSYCGSDQTLMAELALRGEFYEINEILFLRRVYQGESPSLKAHASIEELATWFDTRNHDRVSLFWSTLLWEHVKAIWLSPLNWQDKCACLRLLRTSPYAVHWSRQIVFTELKRAIRETGAKYAMRAIKQNHRDYLPYRIWALWDGLKYRRWDWVGLACSRPGAATHTALLEFVAAQLKRRHDPMAVELLSERFHGGCEACQPTAPLAVASKSVAR